MKLFTSCLLLPGDIDGIIIPKMLHYIFEAKTGIAKPHPYTIYLTNDGDLLIGFTKEKMTKPLVPLDMIVDTWKMNEKLGIM